MILFGFTALFLFCLAAQTPPDFSRTSAAALKSMAAGLTHPDWIFFFSAKKDGLGYLLLETICIAIVGTAIGAFLAAPLAFLNTRRFVPAPTAFFFNLIIMAIRSIPFLIYGLIFIRVSGPGAFTGVLTLAVCSIGLLTKRFTECLEAIDPGPYRRSSPWVSTRFQPSATAFSRRSLRHSAPPSSTALTSISVRRPFSDSWAQAGSAHRLSSR